VKIWIVMKDSHEDKWPVGAFSSKEKADEYVHSVNDGQRHEIVWIADDEGFKMDTPKFPSLL
jgi:hypothetical protein